MFITAIIGALGGGGATAGINKFRSKRNEKDIEILHKKINNVAKNHAFHEVEIAKNYVTKSEHNRLEDKMEAQFKTLGEKVECIPLRIMEMMNK